MMIRLRGSVQDCIGRREAKVGVDAPAVRLCPTISAIRCRRVRHNPVASPSEPDADMVKPAVYPFKCREWDLATARPPAHRTVPTIAARPVGLSQRERIAFARMGTE
jgi:hypothetical protein